MRNKVTKKIVAVILSAAMVFTMTPSGVYASENVAVAESAEVVAEETVGAGAEEIPTEEPDVQENVSEDVTEVTLAPAENSANQENPTGEAGDAYQFYLNLDDLSVDSEVEFFYSETETSEKIQIMEAEAVPSDCYIWVKANHVPEGYALTCNYVVDDWDPRTLACVYETDKYVKCWQMDEDCAVIMREEKLYPLTVEVADEDTSNYKIEDFTIKRKDGTQIYSGDMVVKGDYITVNYNDFISAEQPIRLQLGQSKWSLEEYSDKADFGIETSENQILKISSIGKISVSINMPQEYTSCLRFSTDKDGIHKVNSGDIIPRNAKLYAIYNGEKPDGVDVFRFEDKNGNKHYNRSEYSFTTNIWWGTANSEFCEITVSGLSKRSISLDNKSDGGIEITCDSTVLTDSFMYTPGDLVYFTIKKEAPDGYYYKLNCDNGSFYTCLTGLWPYDLDEWTELEVTLEKEADQPDNTIHIDNDFADDVVLYKDVNYSLPIKEGDECSYYIYAKLVREMEKGYYYELVSQGETEILSNETRKSDIYLGSGSNKQISIIKKKRLPLSVNLGDHADVIHLYYDSEITKQIDVEDGIVPGTCFYAALDMSKADEDFSYKCSYKRGKEGYKSSFSLSKNNPKYGISFDSTLTGIDDTIYFDVNGKEPMYYKLEVLQDDISEDSNIEFSYSELYDSVQKTVITKDTKIPVGSYIFMRVLNVATDKAIFCHHVDGTNVETSVPHYQDSEKKYIFCFCIYEDEKVILEEQDTVPFRVQIFEPEGDNSRISTDMFTFTRSDGSNLSENGKIVKGDSIHVTFIGELMDGNQIRAWMGEKYNSRYLSAEENECDFNINSDVPILALEEIEQKKLYLQVPEAYEDMISFATDSAGTNKVYNEDSVPAGTSLYAIYDGTEIDGAAGLKLMVADYSNGRYFVSGVSEAKWIGNMGSEDCTIDVTTFQKSTIKLTNNCSDAIKVYSDSNYQKELTGSFEYMAGDQVYFEQLIPADEGYQYEIREKKQDGSASSWCPSFPHSDTYDDIVNEIIISMVPIYVQPPLVVVNDYENYVGLYRDEYCLIPLKDGDQYSGIVYTKLLQEPENALEYYRVEGTGYTNVSVKQKQSSFYVNSGATITVTKKAMGSLELNLGGQENLFHFYSDIAHTKELKAGDGIMENQSIYAVLDTEQADVEKEYLFENENGFSFTLSSDYPFGGFPVGKVTEGGSYSILLTETDRIMFQISVEEPYQSYVAAYRDSSCMEELKDGDYVRVGVEIYLKQIKPIADKSIGLQARQEGSPDYIPGNGSILRYWYYNRGPIMISTYTRGLVNLELGEYEGKLKFYSGKSSWDESSFQELNDGDGVENNYYIFAKLTEEGEGLSIPVHIEGARSNSEWYDTPKDSYSSITVSGTGYVQIARMTEKDATFTARNEYHLQILENELDGIEPFYSYSTDGENYVEVSPEDDVWVPFGTKLIVKASGVNEDQGLSVRKKRDVWKGYICNTLITDEDEAVFELSYESPIIVGAVGTTSVKITNLVPNSENYLSCTYRNGQILHDGDKIAPHEQITISVNGAPDNQVIHTRYSVGVKNWDEYDCGSGDYYHKYNSEGPAEYTIEAQDGQVELLFETVVMRKVTVTRPEGYDVNISYYDLEHDENCDYNFEDSEQSFFVPDGVKLRFSCWDGIKDNTDALRITSNEADAAINYLYDNDSSTYCTVSEQSYDFVLTPVNVYEINRSSDIFMRGNSHRTYWDYDEKTDTDIYKTFVPYDEPITLYKDYYRDDETCMINAYHTGVPGEKVLDERVLDYENTEITFHMPSFPVTVDADNSNKEEYTINIKENDFSSDSKVIYKKYRRTTVTENVKDGDTAYEKQKLHVYADSLAENKKMVVTVKKTGTNEYATGSSKGMLLDGITSAFFNMFNFPITIDVTEKERKGSGKPVYIYESYPSGTNISYSVDDGDLVAKGEDITINVSRLRPGTSLTMSVICPDENLVASGDGMKNDFDKPYFTKEITSTGEVKFEMPDYPVTIRLIGQGEGSGAIALNSATISMNDTSFAYNGSEIKPEYTVLLNGYVLDKNVDYTESFSENVNTGMAKVTVTGTGLYTGSLSKEFTIAKRALDDTGVTISMTDKVIFNYRPSYTPKPVIRIGDYLLTEGTDYTLTYANNKGATEKEPASVTIEGMGNISGTITKTFEIVKETQELTDAVVQIDGDTFEYNGEEFTPQVSVICNHVELERDIDYTVAYLNNVNAGTAAVKISGLGSYTGSAKAEFTISRRQFTNKAFDAVVANQKYKKNIKEYVPAPIITYMGEKLVEGVDYSLKYENNTGETADATITVIGLHNYEGSKVLHFSILKEAFDASKMKITVAKGDYIYNGNEWKPAVTVKYKGEELKESSDYEVSYQDNVNVGNGKVTISGIGEYAGSKNAAFKITPKLLSSEGNYKVDEILAQEFNGMNFPTPSVTDLDTGAVLTDSDIFYTYQNNKKVNAKAVVKIKGTGNYKGNITKNFEIKKLSFNSYEYSIEDCAYTGAKLTPDIIAINMVTGERVVLKTGAAVKVKFDNNIEIGDKTARAVIRPKNKNFFDMGEGTEDSKEIKFSIVKCNLEDVTIIPVKPQKYNKGREVKPKLNVKVGATKLKVNKQYKITYSDNREKGYATATITPVDEAHFTGSQTIKFVIK